MGLAETLIFNRDRRATSLDDSFPLYTRKDIFLREPISNASDALDRPGFKSITGVEVLDS